MSARLKIILSMTIFGTLGLFVRYIPVSSGELALYRAVLATVLIGLYLLLSRQSLNLKEIGSELPWLFLSGAAMGFNWILLFEAYKYTAISLATLCYYFAPVIVTVACPILFREKLTGRQIVCFLGSTLGLVLIIGVSGLEKGSSNLKGILFGLGAAAFYATVILLNKKTTRTDGLRRTIIQFISAIVVLLPYVLCTSGIHVAEVTGRGLICLLILGLFHTGVTYVLYFSSLKELPGQQAAVLSYIDPLVSVVVSVLFLREPLTVLQAVGGILVLGFTFWNEIAPQKETTK